MNENVAIRVLLMGKTGAGKSSFVNYFLNDDLAKTGVGKPVTQNIDKYTMNIRGVKTELFDTKGLEVVNVYEILEEILAEIKRRNNQTNVLEWFHTIFYCVSMKNARLEDFEVNLLKEINGSISQEVHIILTNCDGIDDDRINSMKQKIYDSLGENSRVYPVCSIAKTNRAGKVSNKFGIETLHDEIFKFLWNDISSKISKTIDLEVKQSFDEFLGDLNIKVLKFIDEMNIFKISKIEKMSVSMDKKINKSIKEISKKSNDTIKELLEPAIVLYNNYNSLLSDSVDMDISKYNFDAFLEDVIDEERVKQAFFKTKAGKVFEKIDKEQFDKKLITEMAGTLFNLKKRARESLKGVMDELYLTVEELEVEQSVFNELIKMSEEEV